MKPISLPSVKTKGEESLEEALSKRKSERSFTNQSLRLDQVSQILWSAKMIPSAGGLYPLEIYLVVGEQGVEDLDSGVYHYLIKDQALVKIKEGDLKSDLARAALGQEFLSEAPVILVMAAEYERTTHKYGQRGLRYVHTEIGHMSQNVYLQVESLGLGTVAVGAFDDQTVSQLLGLPLSHSPLYIMPVGYPKQG